MPKKPKINRIGRVIFITGTDTGVGKTVLTALLLRGLRGKCFRVLALKPFCSGDRRDAQILQEMQDGELSLDEINPYFFTQPLAPAVANRSGKVAVEIEKIINQVRKLKTECEYLLIEGCGGLLVPIAENLFVVDLIAYLKCEVILVAPNKLGVINHTLLSIEALHRRNLKKVICVLAGQRNSDDSSLNNAETLAGIVNAVPIFQMPYINESTGNINVLKRKSNLIKKIVAHLLRDA